MSVSYRFLDENGRAYRITIPSWSNTGIHVGSQRYFHSKAAWLDYVASTGIDGSETIFTTSLADPGVLSGKDTLLSLGFSENQIFCINEHLNEKFYLNNGSYFIPKRTELHQDIAYSIWLYNRNNVHIGGASLDIGWNGCTFFPIITKSNVDTRVTSINADFATGTGTTTQGTVYVWSGQEIPNTHYSYDADASSFFEGALRDPYDVPPSTSAGADATYDFTSSDDVDFPPLPTLSAINTGFISLWSPTNEQMLNLSRYMWNADILTADFWKRLLANPMDLVFGLSIIPVDLRAPESSYVGVSHNVVVGLIDTQIEMDTIVSQWVEYDCGYIDISETWGAYLDYDPYTKLDIYLPFCGVHPLRIDDFMPGRIHVKYHIDLLSGSCVAIVKSTKTNEHGDVLNSVVYQFMGNCATQIPVTASQYADAVRSAITIAASIGSMAALGVAGGAAAGAAKTPAVARAVNAKVASKEISLGASAIENVMTLKPSIERSGAIGSSGALLSVQVPYLILTRPRQAKPDNQQTYTGYPSFITENLVDLNGWTEVQAIHLEGIPCTVNELSEIDELLKSGVIF